MVHTKMDNIKHFTLAPEFICGIIIHKKWNTYTKNGRIPTSDELLLLIKGEGECSVTSNDDHPEFAKLRKQLGEEGYIKIEPGWWNGDRVIKEFTLNNKLFEVGEQFSCGSAMQFGITRKEDYDRI